MLEQTRQTRTTESTTGLHAKRVVDPVPVLGELPDLLLVERTRARDTRAFETLMRRYNRRLYRIARSIIENADAAEEAVRAAYVRAFVNLDRYEPAGKFGAWLARLAFNEALAMRRHSPAGAGTADRPDRTAPFTAITAPGRTAPFGTSQPSASSGSAAPAAPDSSDAAASRLQLERAIDALPEVFRTVLVLRVVEELSGVEVAVCLGLNETTVRTRLYRAQQRLKVDVARRLRAEPSNIFELSPERNDHIVSQVFARLHTAMPPADSR
ncbi:MAG: sigma-70 family RNA polymerase sigma factor [Steroidobacteraceae bacterium]